MFLRVAVLISPRLYGQVGASSDVGPSRAGSILTLRNRIEPLASTTSVERTPRKMQSTKLSPSITAPGGTSAAVSPHLNPLREGEEENPLRVISQDFQSRRRSSAHAPLQPIE